MPLARHRGLVQGWKAHCQMMEESSWSLGKVGLILENLTKEDHPKTKNQRIVQDLLRLKYYNCKKKLSFMSEEATHLFKK